MNERCVDCQFWRGICAKGHKNKIANDDACEEFKQKSGKIKPFIPDFLRYTC